MVHIPLFPTAFLRRSNSISHICFAELRSAQFLLIQHPRKLELSAMNGNYLLRLIGPPIHPLIIYPAYPCKGLEGNRSQRWLILEETQGSLWTGLQSNTGPTYRDKQSFTQCKVSLNLTPVCMFFRLWEEAEVTVEKPT